MKARYMWGLALTAAACALNPAPVPISGEPADLRALEGEWVGEYRSFETGRSGSIVFTLKAGADTAVGDVVMVPKETAGLAQRPAGVVPQPPPAPQVLTITFVRVSGNVITGTIDPYPSPDCECALLTTFRGEITGDRVEGSFITHHSGFDSGAQKGTWWATKTRK
jgi:hypothetical protein